MRKRVSFGSKQAPAAPATPTPDQWVESRNLEGMKRLTIDVPASLHARIKSQCALRGVKMADEIRALLERHFSEEG